MDSIFSASLYEAPDSAKNENLERDPVLSAFVALATYKEARQVGDPNADENTPRVAIVPEQAPDWRTVLKEGKALLARSRNLDILRAVSWAALQQYGLPGLAQGLFLMANWVENQWDHLYPGPGEEPEDVPFLRRQAVSEFSDPKFLNDFRLAVFLETPHGAITVSDAENLLSSKPVKGQTVVSSVDELSRALVKEKTRNQERFSALASISSSFTAITSAFKSRFKSEPEFWPDFKLLQDIAAKLERFVAETLPDAGDATPTEDASTTTTATATATPIVTAAATLPDKLNTRSDAFKALALARSYFVKNEPSHPAPLLIQRIERLADLDFFAILKDLTPDGVPQARVLTGMEDENTDY